MRPYRSLVVVLCAIVGAISLQSGALQAAAMPTVEPPASIWHPSPGATWQWQLTGRVDMSVSAEVYNIDMFDNPAAVVDELHARGRKVICYVSAGSWERWRPDADRFPERLLGRSNGWPGERWLDIRKLAVLVPLLEERMDKCASRGYDGIELDNVDGYVNRTGFPLTGPDQRRFNRRLADAAHERGLAVGLKNDLGQIEALQGDFDFAVNEQCFQYRECGTLRPFVDAGKAVFHVEYEIAPDDFCTRANSLGFSSMRKGYDLGPWRKVCW